MGPIHTAQLDKVSPVLILTREVVVHLNRVTAAPTTTTVRGLSTEVRVGIANGLDVDCVFGCDNIGCDLGRVRPGLIFRLRWRGARARPCEAAGELASYGLRAEQPGRINM